MSGGGVMYEGCDGVVSYVYVHLEGGWGGEGFVFESLN